MNEHSDIIHVRDSARHQGARVVAVVEPEAHVLHVVIQHISDVVGDELGNRFTQVGLEVGQHPPDYVQADYDSDDGQKRGLGVCPGIKRLDNIVYSLAEISGQQDLSNKSSDHAQVGYYEPPLVVERYTYDSDDLYHVSFATRTPLQESGGAQIR